jgi:competence protein ComEA
MADNVVGKLKDAFEELIGNKKALVKILSVVLILLVALILRIHEQGKADITIESADTAEELEYSDESGAESSEQIQVIFVDIGGAVEKPGVYQVSKDTRLFEVIDMAGGLTEDADTDHVNRASFVEDGQKIIIPVKGSGDTEGVESASAAEPTAADNGLVNINAASADELKTLNGIGDVMAERIIQYRTVKPFKSIEDIMSVDGIGSKIYEKIKDHITV